MYPQLMAAASRLGPVLSRLAARGGSFATPFWKAQQVDVPDMHPSGRGPLPAPTGPAPPISGISPGYQDTPTPAAPAAPPQMPWWATGDMTKMFPGAQAAPPQTPAPAPTAPQAAPVPMPQARPAEAPQAQPGSGAGAPDTSFFMRNAMSMRDPSTGELIDPSGAQSVRGPDLISKMMAYLHNK